MVKTTEVFLFKEETTDNTNTYIQFLFLLNRKMPLFAVHVQMESPCHGDNRIF